MCFDGDEMDIYRAIRELHAEKVRLDHVITALEEIQSHRDISTRLSADRLRERKSIKAEEREQMRSPSTAEELGGAGNFRRGAPAPRPSGCRTGVYSLRRGDAERRRT